MKSIGVVTDGKSNLGTFIVENLRLVLGDYVQINNHYIHALTPESRIHDDLILVMLDRKKAEILAFLDNPSSIIVIERTILLSSYYQLLDIPAGLDVLVVNDTNETTAETVRLLHELGITHIQLIPYTAGARYPAIQIAITPGERNHVPPTIKEVIDIGNRYIDQATFFTIINKLSLDQETIIQRLKQYLEQIVSTYAPMKGKILENLVKKKELDTILELSNDGVLLTDKDGCIRIANKKIGEFLNNTSMVGKPIHEVLPANWPESIFDSDTLENHVLHLDSKIFNLNKQVLHYYEATYGYYYYFQELTYIRQLEQSLSKKLRSAGHIAKYTFENIISDSPIMQKTIGICKKIAQTDLTVLLIGESGTGKELIAQSIHNASTRKNGPFIAINSAAMPEHLLESELFGYEEGAFTGAAKGGKKGLILQANHGTVFLDEIGDMPIHLQTKLLRILQEKQIMAIGSGQVIDIDVRFIVATNRNLEAMTELNQFRVDLFYRINTCQITLPPLRERREDVLAIAHNWLGNTYTLSLPVQETLSQYNFKGNIRELINVLSYSRAMCTNHVIQLEDLPDYLLNNRTQHSISVISNASSSIFHLTEIDSHDQRLMILKRLRDKGPMGRTALIRECEVIGHTFTEAEMKIHLSKLKQEGLITSGSGRSGSSITAKGLTYL